MSEVVEEKATFVDNLKKWVKGIGKTDEEKYIMQEVEKMLSERNRISPIIDPEAEKRFKAEMTKFLREAMDNAKATKKPEEKEEREEKEEAAKKQEIEEENKKPVENKNSSVINIDDKNIGYLDRLEMLHLMKLELHRECVVQGKMILEDKQVYELLLLQKAIERDREKYISGLDEKAKAELVEIEEKYKCEELDIEKPQNLKYSQDLQQLGELNAELRNINKYIEERQEEMRKDNVKPGEYKKDLEQKQYEFNKVMLMIQQLDPQKLQEIANKKAKHTKFEKEILGADYSENVYSRSSDKFKKILNDKTTTEKVQAHTILSENRFLQKEGIERTIRESEFHRKELEKELKEINQKDITPENQKRKAEVLKELHIVDTKIDSYRTQQNSIEDSDELVALVAIDMENKKMSEEIEDIEKDFAPIEKKLEKAQEQEGQEIFHSNAQKVIEKNIEKEALKTAVATGVTAGIVSGSAGVGVIAGTVAKKEKEKGLRNEWEDAVNTEYDKKAVEEKVKRDKAIAEELEEQEQSYGIERIRKD